jgi:hypothetical protein
LRRVADVGKESGGSGAPLSGFFHVDKLNSYGFAFFGRGRYRAATRVLAYNLTRVMNILPLIAAIQTGVRIGATKSLTADRANHVDSSSQLRQHAKLSLASPVSLGRNVFTRPRSEAAATGSEKCLSATQD